MRILSVHAHFDDFEFTAAGTFEMWRRKEGQALQARVIVCTDGKAGHHALTREQTAAVRIREQKASVRIGGYQFQQLHLPNGTVPREACLRVDVPLLAALWKAIRDFEPDYLFCPPIPADPLVGVHVDHVAVAEAVRNVAYMINVPHAFTPEYPTLERKTRAVKVPAILNVYDAYVFGSNEYDVAVDVEPAFARIAEMSWCHQSQIREWLPWVGRHHLEPPGSLTQWSRTLRRRFQRQQRELGIRVTRATEVFTVTAWGQVPRFEDLIRDLPELRVNALRLSQLKRRLNLWRGAQ